MEASSPTSFRESSIRLLVIEALTFFCQLHIGEDKSVLQTKMMNKLFTVQEDLTSCMDFRISLTILESLTRCKQDEIQRQYADAPLEFLFTICQKDYKDEELSHKLFCLLPFFFEYATKYRHAPKRIIEMLSVIYKRIHKRNCSVSMHGDYMNCVCDIVRVDPDFACYTTTEENMTMLDNVLDYISHELFILRVQAVRCLQKLMSFDNVAYEWKKQIFIKVEKIVVELLSTNQQPNSNTQRYYLEIIKTVKL